jgi:hypothetical protein
LYTWEDLGAAFGRGPTKDVFRSVGPSERGEVWSDARFDDEAHQRCVEEESRGRWPQIAALATGGTRKPS